MCRKIEACAYDVQPLKEDEIAGLIQNAKVWLLDQAGKHDLTTLLAHAGDGLIWGVVEEGELRLAHDAFPEASPELDLETLQQARLFGKEAEIMVWRGGDGAWHGRLLRDAGAPGKSWRFDEPQILWGDRQEGEPKGGFVLAVEGQEGQRHAVPAPAGGIDFGQAGHHPLRLGVRHYLEADDGDGMTVIRHSRLTGLWAEGRKEG